MGGVWKKGPGLGLFKSLNDVSSTLHAKPKISNCSAASCHAHFVVATRAIDRFSLMSQQLVVHSDVHLRSMLSNLHMSA